MLTYSQRRSSARRGAQLAEQAIRDETARQAVERAREYEAAKVRRKAAREAEKARLKLTADDVKGARLVRDEFGWHAVVRVSAKSVTVKTVHSWTERISLDKILEVRV